MQDPVLPEPGGAPHVLIAEDSPTQAAGLRAILGERWEDVRCAKDGQEALDMMKEARPAIVVSDIEMPRLTGYQLSRSMKADPQLRVVPIILLTELASPRAISDAMDSLADCLLMKPYDPDRLIAVMEGLMAGSGDGPDVAAGAQTVPTPAQYHSLRRLLHYTLEELADHHRRLVAAEEEVEIVRAALGGGDDLDVEAS